MGDLYFDLANFAIHHELTDAQDEGLLTSYFGKVTDVGFARLKLMKIVAELREAMWCMVVMNISSQDFDFTGYAATHFTRYRRALDDGRVRRWRSQVDSGGEDLDERVHCPLPGRSAGPAVQPHALRPPSRPA